MKIEIGDIAVCLSGYTSSFKTTKPMDDPEYGGSGYSDGAIFKVMSVVEHPFLENKDALFSRELHAGVFRSACRRATQEEIQWYNSGIRNIPPQLNQYTIGYKNKDGLNKKFMVSAANEDVAMDRLKTSLANHWDELTGINYVMQEK